MKYSYTLVRAYVECEDCGWSVESKNAQAIAKIHATKYKHRVTGELGILIGYYGHD